jgi:hypothetical protein
MKDSVTIVKCVELTYGKVELRSDNILTFRPDLRIFKEYDLTILAELLGVFKEMADGCPRPYLTDNRYISGIITREEQAYINENFGDFATKAAMLTQSPIIRVMLNSYNSIFKPKVELKLFTDEEKAVEWLLS